MMPTGKHAVSIRFKQADGVQAREVEGDLFLAAPGPGTIHHLNRMAAAVWRAFAEPRTAEELIALFRAAFPDEPRRSIAKDVADTVAFLAARKLIVRAKLRPGTTKRVSPTAVGRPGDRQKG
jgi:coenzyme PQQ synthesis protein D (PqqD)